jgi:hypothetical protein
VYLLKNFSFDGNDISMKLVNRSTYRREQTHLGKGSLRWILMRLSGRTEGDSRCARAPSMPLYPVDKLVQMMKSFSLLSSWEGDPQSAV